MKIYIKKIKLKSWKWNWARCIQNPTSTNKPTKPKSNCWRLEIAIALSRNMPAAAIVSATNQQLAKCSHNTYHHQRTEIVPPQIAVATPDVVGNSSCWRVTSRYHTEAAIDLTRVVAAAKMMMMMMSFFFGTTTMMIFLGKNDYNYYSYFFGIIYYYCSCHVYYY